MTPLAFPVIENCPDPDVISYLEWEQEQRQIHLAARCISCAITRHKKAPCCPCTRHQIYDPTDCNAVKHDHRLTILRDLNNC